MKYGLTWLGVSRFFVLIGAVAFWGASFAATNHAPTITGTPPTKVVAGKAYSFQPTARDADGNTLRFTVSNKPAWAAFSSSTGRLWGTAAEAQVGSYNGIVVAVTDGKAWGKLPSFGIVVASSKPVTPPTAGGPRPDLGTNASLHGKGVFPASDPWNQAVDIAPVDANSAAILGRIGTSKPLHPEFGANWNGGPFGLPYIIVPDTQPRVPVSFKYADNSDAGPYPIPLNPPIEPGSDRHVLIITRDELKLFEIFNLQPNGSGGWNAGSGAIFDLINGTQRPPGWTSADAAGLPIFPGLVRYDEVYEAGLIAHALRFTVANTRRAYIPPATHAASTSTDPLLPPMGMRVRLRASFAISSYPAPAQVILRALKKYGMIVADNGGDFFVTGTADARWNDAVNDTLKQVKVGDFEVVQMRGIVTP
jgi:hypothetical protein